MIKPIDEYSPEDRAFVEYCQQIRSQSPQPPHDPGPFNSEKVRARLEKIRWDEEGEEPAFRFAPRPTNAEG